MFWRSDERVTWPGIYLSELTTEAQSTLRLLLYYKSRPTLFPSHLPDHLVQQPRVSSQGNLCMRLSTPVAKTICHRALFYLILTSRAETSWVARRTTPCGYPSALLPTSKLATSPHPRARRGPFFQTSIFPCLTASGGTCLRSPVFAWQSRVSN
jgi:hypothetical protein